MEGLKPRPDMESRSLDSLRSLGMTILDESVPGTKAFMNHVNAFVLAGGQSKRMGRDKALLELDGRPLIEHAVGKLRGLGFTPRIVGSRPDLARFAEVIPDTYPMAGPLGGIATALELSDAEQNLFLAVDLPWVSGEFLRWMTDRAEITAAAATVPRLQGMAQPLCAIYGRGLLPHMQAALAEGDAKIMRAVERASERIDSFDAESIAAAEGWPSPQRWFANLNTPGDFERAVLEQSLRIQ